MTFRCALLLFTAACGAASTTDPDSPVGSASASTSDAPAPSVAVLERTCAVAPDAKAPAVRRVVLRGTELRDACNAVSSAAGGPVDAAVVESDVRALFATGLFEDVTAVVMDDKAIDLVFEVKERARVAKLEVGGANDADASKAIASLLVPPKRVSGAWLRQSERKLKDALALLGFLHAEVRHELEPRGGSVVVRFTVTEGPRAVVSAVRVEGLKVAKQDEASKDLAIVKGKPATQEALEHDKLTITAALYDAGLLESSVRHRIAESSDKRSVEVVYVVEEGPVFKLGTVAVQGPGVLPKSAYESILKPLKKGSVFKRSDIAKAIAEIQAVQEKAGAARDIEPQTSFEPGKAVVNVTFVLLPL